MKPLGADHAAAARDRLRARAAAAGLEGLLLLRAPNLAYATGLFLSANERPMGLWLPVDGEPILFMPALEAENATLPAIPDLRLYPEFPGKVPPVLWMLSEIGVRTLGIDALEARLLDAARDLCTRLDLTDHAMAERMLKTRAELDLIAAAATYADRFLHRLHAQAADIIGQGGTEQDLMTDALGHARAALLRDHGAAFAGTPLGISASVHSGPRAALPHGAVLPRRPQPGETLIAGIGAHLGGYHAESGATRVLGAPDDDQRAVMAAMSACNDAAIATARPGTACADVDRAARDQLRGAGYGPALRHRIGHGMGLEGHEAPWLSTGDATPIAAGMVFSSEPGIYRPDHDGWRTIDTLIVTETGTIVPSRFQAETPPDARIISL